MRAWGWIVVFALAASPARADVGVDLTPSGPLPTGIVARGKVIATAHWIDKNGDNFALFTEQNLPLARSRFLSAIVLARKPNQLAWRQLRTMRDGVSRCKADLIAGFLPESIELSDLDSDGVNELTFAYTMACTRGVRPDLVKLFVVEGRRRYFLFGKARVQIDEQGTKKGGTHRPWPKPKAWPNGFLDHANTIWERVAG